MTKLLIGIVTTLALVACLVAGPVASVQAKTGTEIGASAQGITVTFGPYLYKSTAYGVVAQLPPGTYYTIVYRGGYWYVIATR